jgi:hypothetical protein
MSQATGTVFANISELPIQRSSAPDQAGAVNFRNNFRIGDTSSTPLQFVYEAADCRIWYTREMLYDPTFLWGRVASIAFASNYTPGTPYQSPYCIQGSTDQPTSLSGGLKNGTLGPQTPPPGAKSTLEGWLINGTVLTNSSESSLVTIKNITSSATSPSGTGSATGSAASSSSTSAATPVGPPSWFGRCVAALCAVALGGSLV